MAVQLNLKHTEQFVSSHELEGIRAQVESAHEMVMKKNGLGQDFLGWVDLPRDYDKGEFVRIQNAAQRIISDSDVLVVIGIGGSYLGARAALELLKTPYYNEMPKNTPNIYFIGNSISPSCLNAVLKLCENKRVSVNVISKSGTTTEPALAFRVFRALLEERYGKDEACKHIYATTDKSRGTLKSLADREGYETFVIPDDVGGRYSVLTAVGLLPMAVAGIDIAQVMNGAFAAYQKLMEPDIAKNDCLRYAAMRNIFYRKGKQVELMVAYEPAFALMNEWYKQLFGESEGKDKKGLFPASVICSTDLHSMGQFIQDGSPCLFETVVSFGEWGEDFFLEQDAENLDGLNFLAGQNMSMVNRRAMEGTILAHTQGGVPNMVLEVADASPYSFGYLVYFLEKACAVSGYMLGVNPFDQPGVENYKTNMFALLGKPGFEEMGEELRKLLTD